MIGLLDKIEKKPEASIGSVVLQVPGDPQALADEILKAVARRLRR